MSLRHLYAVALAAFFCSLGCTPRLAGDGSYGCGAGACPAGTFCHSNLRCYSTPESDAGPRRDAYSEGIAAYGACTGGGCRAGLECRMGLTGQVCIQPCETNPSACTDGTACDQGPGAMPGRPGRDCFRLCIDCPASIGHCGGPMNRYCIPNAW